MGYFLYEIFTDTFRKKSSNLVTLLLVAVVEHARGFFVFLRRLESEIECRSKMANLKCKIIMKWAVVVVKW